MTPNATPKWAHKLSLLCGGLCLQVFASPEGPEPDQEFGCVRAVLGPQGSGLEDKALVQLRLGASSTWQQWCLALAATCCVTVAVGLLDMQDLLQAHCWRCLSRRLH
jgi:hypothetical protein